MKEDFTYHIGLPSVSLPNQLRLRILYGASAKASKGTTSLNEYLKNSPPLQNSLYDILVRSQMRPIILCGIMQKDFKQIQIRELERPKYCSN